MKFLLPDSVYEYFKVIYLALNSKKFGESQHGELNDLLRYLPENRGKYVDIGGGNPRYLSNTYNFYKKKWSGYFIDPIKANCQIAKILRPRDKQFCWLIGDSNQTCEFFLMEPSFYSTTNEDYVKHWVEQGAKVRKKTNLKFHAISELEFQCSPQDPSFFSIDVEGNEFKVLKSINFEIQKPRVIIIENPNFELNADYKKIEKILKVNGYKLEIENTINQIWVHKSFLSSNEEKNEN